MFKKLKDKIAEEVKQSPQRFQQMAQAAQNAVSSASSTTSEISGSDNFFSLTEEDTPQNSPVKKQQQPNSNSNISLNNIPNNKHIGNNNGVPLANRSRRLSNSSVASDVSFRLPTFDSPAAYHLQSDLDVSASEVEDSGLSVNNQLELISKEQLHSAYRRALDRYQKYRERYTDLAKRYRDLEKDNTKARAVLVETQDKALRRISELREQCSLEQQAKAHLEAALRLEMDEMQYVVQSLKSKLELVNEQNEKDKISKKTETDNLINLDTEHMPNGETDSISKENIAKLEQMLDDYKLQIEEEKSKLIIQKEATVKQEAQFNEMKTKLTEYENKISELQKREEENILLIAENKLSIHSELENKDLEVKNIKEKLFALEKDAKQSATEKAALQEKINQLNQKLNNENKNKEQQKELESKIKTVNEEKLKLESKFVDFEKTILNLENENSNFKLNIKKFEDCKNNSHIKEEEMQELIKQHKENYSKVTKENDNLQEQLTNKLREMEELTNLNMLMKSECQKQLEDKTEIEEKLKQVYDEKEKVNTELKQIKDKVEKVNNKFKKLSDEKLSLQSQNDQLHGEMKRCKEEINNLLQQKSNLTEEIKNSKIINENTESEAIKSLQESMKTSISQLEQKLSEKSLEMDEAVTKNVNEIKTLTETNQELTENLQNSEKIKNEKIEEIQTAKQKIESLRNEKKDLEKTLEREIREKTELKTQVTNIIQEIGRLEEQLKEVKDSYTQIQTEKQTLEEKFEKVQKHHNETKNKLEKESTHKLNNKLKEFETKLHEIQSENSQLADSNCLLEENIRRTIEDLKKQQSSNTDLENQFKQEKNSLNEKIKEIRDKYNQSEDKIKNLNDQLSQCTGDHAKLFNEKELLEHQHRSLQDALEAKEKEKLCVLDTNKCLQDELALVKENLNVANASIECLENEKMELIKSVDNLSEYREKMQIDNKNLTAQLNASETKLNDKMNNELENLRLQLANKEKECADLIQAQNALQKALDDVKLKSERNDIELSELKEKLSLTEIQLAELQKEKDYLIESNDCLNKEIGFLNNKSQHRLNELENLLKHTNDEKQTLKDSINKNQTDIEKKLENYEELKIENEYLNTLTKQLESEKSKFESNISQLNDKDNQREKEIADLKIRINQNEKMLEEKDSEIKKLINEFVELEKANVGKQQDEINKNQKLNTDLTSLQQTLAERNEEITKLQKEIANQVIIINDLNKDYDSVNQKFEKATGEINVLNETVEKLKENAVTQDKSNVLELENSQLNESISELKIKLESEQESNETKLRDLASERLQLLDKLKVDSDNSKLEYEKLKVELDKVKQENIDLQEKQQASIDSETVDPESMQELKSKNDDLEVQLKKIMHEVQDVSNRNLFLEQKCENYLILEQSNERLKLTNDKLSRQLDETLVSMHHNEGLSANTEFEYLKNILFQYLSGNIGNNNNSPLVKVIAAVLKFTPQQTQLVIEKEAQRHTLMGQLNNLL